MNYYSSKMDASFDQLNTIVLAIFVDKKNEKGPLIMIHFPDSG